MTLEQRQEREMAIVRLMIGLYCRKHHGQPAGLCADCSSLASYADERIMHCPLMQAKTFCSACQSPCYRPDMRSRIRQVMRYAGPRMLWYHPVTAFRHFLLSRK